MLAAYLLPLLFAQEVATLPVLQVNAPQTQSIDAQDLAIPEAQRISGSTTYIGHGGSWQFQLPADGVYRISVVSHDFDAFMVLRMADGTALATDDDGYLGAPATHSQIVFKGKAKTTYTADACRLWNLFGEYTITLTSGPAPTRTTSERALALVDDAKAWIARTKTNSKDPNTLTFAQLRLAKDCLSAALYTDAADAAQLCLRGMQTLYPDSGNVLTVQSILGQALSLALEHEKSVTVYTDAYALAQKITGPASANSLLLAVSLAEATYQSGNLNDALQLLEQSQSHLESAQSDVRIPSAYLWMALGRMYHYQDRLDDAEYYLEKAVQQLRELKDQDPAGLARGLLNLGALVRGQGDIAEGRRLLEESLALHQQLYGPDHPETAFPQNELAVLLHGLGDYLPARKAYEEALRIRKDALGVKHPKTSEIFANLALLDMDQGKLKRARMQYEAALMIAEAAGGKAARRIPIFRSNIGHLLRKEGKPEEALPVLEQFLQESTDVFGAQHTTTALAHAQLAAALSEIGKAADGLKHQQIAVEIWATVDGAAHARTSAARGTLARMLWESGNLEAAWAEALSTHRAMSQHLHDLYWTLTESERQMYLLGHQSGLELLVSLALALDQPDALSFAYDAILQSKGRITRSLMESRDQWLSQVNPEAVQALKELRAVKARLSNVLHVQKLIDLKEQNQLVSLIRDEQAMLERKLLNLAGKPKDPIPTVGWRTVHGALPEASVSLDFSILPRYTPEDGWTAPHIFVWILSANASAPELVDLGKAEAVGEFIDKLIPRDRGGRSLSSGVTTEAELAKLLWKPLEAVVEEAELVFLCLDGFLGRLPFEILQPSKDEFLLERHAFVYLDSMAQLVTIAATPLPESLEGSLLSVGNVQYDELALESKSKESEVGQTRGAKRDKRAAVARMSFSWDALEFSGQEAKEILRIHSEMMEWKEGRLIEKQIPTEASLKKEFESVRYLHLATHGFFMGDRARGIKDALKDSRERKAQKLLYKEKQMLGGLVPGLLCGLVLAGANGSELIEGEDGYLTAEEIRFLDLTQCELATLSACETSLGSLRTGEGMISLRRAFHLAGAKTVLASLWKVDDESTQRLMEDFYRNWWYYGDMSRAEAMQEARLGLLEEQREEDMVDPKKWGAFILSGDWR